MVSADLGHILSIRNDYSKVKYKSIKSVKSFLFTCLISSLLKKVYDAKTLKKFG